MTWVEGGQLHTRRLVYNFRFVTFYRFFHFGNNLEEKKTQCFKPFIIFFFLLLGPWRVERRWNETGRRRFGATKQRSTVAELHRRIQHDLKFLKFSFFFVLYIGESNKTRVRCICDASPMQRILRTGSRRLSQQ